MKFLKSQEDFDALGIKHFKAKEFACKCCGDLRISTELVILLDNIREALGMPLVVNSGYRCRLHNEEVGGSPSSSHLKGLAVDLKVPTSRIRFLLLRALLSSGIERIGLGKDFIHVDLDPDKPPKVAWHYEEKWRP